MSLLSELKRRNVVRVAAAYLVSSWLLIEMSDIMFPAFGFPPNAMKWLIGALGLGLIPMLLFSWVYELTPDGIVKDLGPDQENPENLKTGRKLDQVTIMMILLALSVVAIERFVLPQRVIVPAQTVSTEAEATPQRQVVVTVPAIPIPEGPSVAVLPFANMSPDPENAYFADGISEEILNVLAGIEGLKVASRTSAFNFRGTDTSIPDIARQLGVAHVLEGSVRKSGMRVRITAQLIDASNDQHLWSDSYDRDLDDIFAVQEEIASAISSALGEALGVQVGDVAVGAPTADLEAYELFLEGRTLFYQRGLALRQTLDKLHAAVERDSEFAGAWALLAATYGLVDAYLPEFERAESYPLAIEAANRALALDDSLALPHAALGLIAQNTPDHVAARDHFEAALARDPNNAMARLWHGINLFSLGYLQRAQIELEAAQAIDPMVGVSNFWLGFVLVSRGETERGLEYVLRAQALGFPVGDSLVARFRAFEGDLETAAALMARFYDSRPGRDEETVARHAAIVTAIRDPSLMDPELDELWVSVLAGRIDEGLAVNRPSWTSVTSSGMWGADMLDARERPLFFEIMREHGLVDLWEADGYPDGCVRVEDPEPRLDCSQ